MEELSYTLTIKKDNAIPIFKKLILDQAIEVYFDEIPEWQKEETLLCTKQINSDPSIILSS